ncbi:hypothetical protein DF053_16850 [Burkholderia cepacia]|nr:hypothetical protein DF053_16850 [Burkholderia cepacia]
MHRRSPCRCTFCSRRPRPRARRRRRPGAASSARAIIGAQKKPPRPWNGNAAVGARRAGAAAGPAGGITAA